MTDSRVDTVFKLDKDMFEPVKSNLAFGPDNIVRFNQDAIEGIRCGEWAQDYSNWAKSLVSDDGGKTFRDEKNYEDLFEYEDCKFAVVGKEDDKLIVQVTDEVYEEK